MSNYYVCHLTVTKIADIIWLLTVIIHAKNERSSFEIKLAV